MTDDGALSKPDEAARILMVDARTLARWAREKKLTTVRTIGGHRRYRETEIRSLASRNKWAIEKRRRGEICRTHIVFKDED